jgi:hypothetical protein
MTYIFRNKESGEIFQDLIFRNDTIQIINPTNEVLEKYGWEILDDYPVIEDEENNEEIDYEDGTEEIE